MITIAVEFKTSLIEVLKPKHNPTVITIESNSSTVRDVLKKLSIKPVELVAIVNGKVVPFDHPVSESDKIELYPLISGG